MSIPQIDRSAINAAGKLAYFAKRSARKKADKLEALLSKGPAKDEWNALGTALDTTFTVKPGRFFSSKISATSKSDFFHLNFTQKLYQRVKDFADQVRKSLQIEVGETAEQIKRFTQSSKPAA